MKMVRGVLIVIFLLSLFQGGAMAVDTAILTFIHDVPREKWTTLSDKKIYFGHQSVGFNIIDGMKDLMHKYPYLKLEIIESDNDFRLSSPGFYHSRIGSNVNPISKIDDFADKMAAGVGATADIAFFKFCFVDIGSDTDIQKVFDHYVKVMTVLKERYPRVKIVHFTVPLGTTLTNWKTSIKTLLGKKDIWEYDANVRKNEFNDLLRNHYAGKEPVFDIAGFESTLTDGKRSTFTKGGKSYFDLAPEYTYDDGHLNEKGRQWVAGHLLIFLAQL